MTGVAIFDTSCLGDLARDHALPRVLASLKSAGLTPVVTMHNVIESAPAPPAQRQALLHSIAAIADVGFMLPWFDRLLRTAGEAAILGKTDYEISGITPNFDLTEAELLELRQFCLDEATRMNRVTRERHAEARVAMQPFIAKRGLRGRWPDLCTFMVDFWDVSDVRHFLADQLWEALAFGTGRPPALLERSDVWRFMLDADAVQMFQGAVAFRQPKQVERMDLLQLPYLALTPQRILITRDGAFGAAVRSLARGRHRGLRVCSPRDVIALAV